MYPCERATENGREDTNGVTRDKSKPVVSPPMPMRSVSRPASKSNSSSGWQEVTLTVPDSLESQPITNFPVPPPRKKKLRRQEQERRREQKMGASSSPEPPMTESSQDPEYSSGNTLLKPRHKNISTVSLPNFSEWTGKSSGSTLQPPSRNLSSNSLSDKESSSLKSLKSSTAERLDSYMKKCRSFGSFLPDELVDKINQARDFSSDDEDHWGGLDDWDLGVIEHFDNHDTGPPVEPTYKLHRRSRNVTTNEERSRNIIKPAKQINGPNGNRVKDDLDNDDASMMDTSSNISDDDSPDIPEGTIEGNPFLDQGNNEDWFDKHYSPQEEYKDIRDIKVKATTKNTSTTDKTDLKTFLYDFNRLAKSPPGSPTQKTMDKRSSAANKTPPPSPESRRDSEDFFIPQTQDSTENDTNKGMDHSNLLKILREFKSLDSKDRDKDAERVLTDLGLPMSLREGDNNNRSIEDQSAQNKVNGNAGTKDSDKLGLTINIDGNNKHSSTASDSSGRSSMTPSLSELEAALTDLLEASAAANVEAQDANHTQPPTHPVPVHKQPLPTISISTVPTNAQES